MFGFIIWYVDSMGLFIDVFQLYVTLIALAIFILPAVIMSVCYGIIIYIIWSKSKYIAGPTSNSKLSRKFTNRNKGKSSEQLGHS